MFQAIDLVGIMTKSEEPESYKSERREFSYGELSDDNLPDNPLALFKAWLQEAIINAVEEPYAMVVSTVDDQSTPHSRVVYLRDLVEEGFIFYTNYASHKAIQLESSRKVALNFLWTKLDRQVRVGGTAERVPEEMSDTYFEGRPRESQIGAWSSAQSTVLKSRQELLDRYHEIEKRFENKPIPRPSFWGGYLVRPVSIEFWQGRTARLHDRMQYSLSNGRWNTSRLSP